MFGLICLCEGGQGFKLKVSSQILLKLCGGGQNCGKRQSGMLEECRNIRGGSESQNVITQGGRLGFSFDAAPSLQEPSISESGNVEVQESGGAEAWESGEAERWKAEDILKVCLD